MDRFGKPDEGLPQEAATQPPEVAALLAGPNPGWNGAPGRGGVVTFSFAETPEAGTTPDAFSPLTAAQADSARAALDAWADVSGLAFVEVPDRPAGIGVDIRFLREGMLPEVAGYAYTPRNGAISLSSSLYATDPMLPGTYGHYVLLHETGHALGLKHPFEGPATLPAAEDSWQRTVMSYDRTGPVPSGPGPLDRAAIAYLYGTQAEEPAWARQAGYDAASDSVTMTGDGSDETIWGTGRRSTADAGGGNDTMLGGGGAELFLGGDGDDSLRGGAGDDTLLGGAGDDFLDGGAGDDLLAGGTGGNTALGGSGTDTLVVTGTRLSATLTRGTSTSGSVTSGGETTIYDGIENFAFLDGELIFDPAAPAMQAYRAFQVALGRAPEAAELGRWADDIQAGNSLSALVSALLDSPEFTLRFGAPGSADFAGQALLDLPGDPAEWMDRLSSGNSLPDFIIGLSESPEYVLATRLALPDGLWNPDAHAATAPWTEGSIVFA